MPDQAFDWLVLTLSNDRPPKIWPEDLIGFEENSRKSIGYVRKAAGNYIVAYSGQMFTEKGKRR